jgi:hypothetical protein
MTAIGTGGYENKEYIVPKGGQFPPKFKGLWIVMKPLQINRQSAYARGGGISTSPTGTRFKFLAPMELQEVLQHEWGEYEGLAGRIAQKTTDIGRGIIEGGQAASALTEGIGEMSKGEARNAIARVVGNLQGANVIRAKMDSPLVYQNSTRRQYIFNFTLAHLGDRNSLEREVLEPIKALRWFSSASLGSGNEFEELVGFNSPHIFKVYTEPDVGIIRLNYAALTTVQPTYQGPYIDGNPTYAELQLQFDDIEPLYKKSWKKGGIITTSS